MWSNGVTEVGVVFSALQTIGRGFLDLSPAARQVIDRIEPLVDDGPILHRRPDHLEAAFGQDVNEILQAPWPKLDGTEFGNGVVAFRQWSPPR